MITFEGLSECLNNLEIGRTNVNRGLNEVLNDGADVAVDYVRAYTPKRTGKAKGSVTKGRVSTQGKFDYKSIKIGYGKDAYWYMWFVHEGTYSKGNPKGIEPREHVIEAFHAGKGAIQRTMATGLEGVVRRAFPNA